MESKAASYLAQTFAESYKRESDLDEAVWRSMPFFAAAIGLAVAVIPAIYRDALRLSFGGWGIATTVLIIASVAAYGIAGWRFWQMIRLRDYLYLPSDLELMAYRNELASYYADEVSEADRDFAILNDLRELNIRLLAECTSQNRRSNAAKAIARSHALLFLAIAFLLVFLAEGTILVREAFPASPSTVSSKAAHDEIRRTAAAPIDRKASEEAGSAQKSLDQGRRELSEMAGAERDGIAVMSDKDREIPDPPPPQEKPEPPAVEHLRKSDPPSPPKR